jgi:hypothetical protein
VYNPKAEARLQASAGSGPRVAQAGITLHRKHELPAGVYTTGGHQPGAPTPSQQQEGYTFYLRPDDGSPAAVRSLDVSQQLDCCWGSRVVPFVPGGGRGCAAVAMGTAAFVQRG